MILVSKSMFWMIRSGMKIFRVLLDPQGCQIHLAGLPDLFITDNSGSNWLENLILVSMPTFSMMGSPMDTF